MTAAQIAREFTRLKRMQRDLRLEEEEHRDHPIAWQCRWLRWLVANRMQRLAKLMRYGAALLMLCGPVLGQHQHPPADSKIHDEFYSTWNMPSDRSKSCCNKMDCAPADAFYDQAKRQWNAWSKVQGGWIVIPESTIERERDVPTGPHLCENSSGVLCFGVGNGT